MKTAMKNTAQCRRARTTTRLRCQRFTFKAVRDAEGEILYYLILPYLWVESENSETPVVEGSYKENYHLTLKTSGEIGICNTCAVGNPADECRWTLSGAITGMTVTNCGESVNLGVDLDEESVAGVTAYGTDVWHVMPICLNMKTESQKQSNTCGAASATMIVNYLMGTTVVESAYISKFQELRGHTNVTEPVANYAVINYYLGGIYDGYDGNYEIAGENLIGTVYYQMHSESLFYQLMSNSLNQGYPAMINIQSRDESIPLTGYYSEGHYVVLKGIYYNPTTNDYEVVVNETHYMYGTIPENRPNAKTKNIGGRDLVMTDVDFYTLYTRRYLHILYKE